MMFGDPLADEDDDLDDFDPSDIAAIVNFRIKK
jgi:hypothetical protein